MSMRIDFAKFAIPHDATNDELRDWINELYTMWADTSDLLAEYQEGEYAKVVRCRDCEYFDTRKCKSQWPFCLDSFCWWGKRKEGGDAE